MAIEIRDFTVTIPAGTAVSAGFTSDMSFPARVVTEIHVRVPPGPRGEVGFAIGSGGIPIVPYGPSKWIVTDNEDLIYPLTAAITSGAWEFLGYNTGSFPHTLRVYFYCELLTAAAGSGSFTPIPTGSLGGELPPPGGSGSGDGSGSGSGVPVITPPTPTPPGGGPPQISPPLILPPSLPSIPGQGDAGGPPPPVNLMLAVGAAGTIGLLAAGGYWPLHTQDDVNSLGQAGVSGAQISAGSDASLRDAFPAGEAQASPSTSTG